MEVAASTGSLAQTTVRMGGSTACQKGNVRQVRGCFHPQSGTAPKSRSTTARARCFNASSSGGVPPPRRQLRQPHRPSSIRQRDPSRPGRSPRFRCAPKVPVSLRRDSLRIRSSGPRYKPRSPQQSGGQGRSAPRGSKDADDIRSAGVGNFHFSPGAGSTATGCSGLGTPYRTLAPSVRVAQPRVGTILDGTSVECTLGSLRRKGPKPFTRLGRLHFGRPPGRRSARKRMWRECYDQGTWAPVGGRALTP